METAPFLEPPTPVKPYGLGTQLVSTVSIDRLFPVLKQWADLPEWAVATVRSGDEIGIWIAKEFIDWRYADRTGEYRSILAEAIEPPFG